MKKTRIGIAVVIAMIASTVVTMSVSAQQRRLALVIGNADYTNAPRLRNPANDAQAMAAELQRLHFRVITVINGS